MTMGLDTEMVTLPTIVAENLFSVSVDYVDETQDQDKVLRTTHGVAHDSLKTPTTRTRGRTWLRIKHTHPPSTFDSHGVSTYVGSKRCTQDATCHEGNGEKRIKIGANSLVSTISIAEAKVQPR